MKKISMEKVIETVKTKRTTLGLTQKTLADKCGMNRTMLGHLENNRYTPSIAQLQALAEVLDFDVTDMFVEEVSYTTNGYNLVITGCDDQCINIARCFSKNNKVTLAGIDSAYDLDLPAVTLIKRSDVKAAYLNADIVVVSLPVNFNEKNGLYDCSELESEVKAITDSNPNAIIIVSASVPVGWTESICRKTNKSDIIFCPPFTFKSVCSEDSRFLSEIIIGCDVPQIEFPACLSEILNQLLILWNAKPLITNTKEAEAINYFADSNMLKIREFFNEIREYSDEHNMSMLNIIDGLLSDVRVFEQNH